jgi:hypothetical protein
VEQQAAAGFALHVATPHGLVQGTVRGAVERRSCAGKLARLEHAHYGATIRRGLRCAAFYAKFHVGSVSS